MDKSSYQRCTVCSRYGKVYCSRKAESRGSKGKRENSRNRAPRDADEHERDRSRAQSPGEVRRGRDDAPAYAAAEGEGAPLNPAVVDSFAHLVSFVRMPGAKAASIDEGLTATGHCEPTHRPSRPRGLAGLRMTLIIVMGYSFMVIEGIAT